jgi:hypothetical protein
MLACPKALGPCHWMENLRTLASAPSLVQSWASSRNCRNRCVRSALQVANNPQAQGVLDFSSLAPSLNVMAIREPPAWDVPAAKQQGLAAYLLEYGSPWFWSINCIALVLATCMASYISRPRGWADLSLLEVNSHFVHWTDFVHWL